MNLVCKSEHLQAVLQRLCRVINILTDTSTLDKRLLLLSELLGRGFDGPTQLHDLGGKTHSTLAHILQLVHTCDELLVVCVADALDL